MSILKVTPEAFVCKVIEKKLPSGFNDKVQFNKFLWVKSGIIFWNEIFLFFSARSALETLV